MGCGGELDLKRWASTRPYWRYSGSIYSADVRLRADALKSKEDEFARPPSVRGHFWDIEDRPQRAQPVVIHVTKAFAALHPRLGLLPRRTKAELLAVLEAESDAESECEEEGDVEPPAQRRRVSREGGSSSSRQASTILAIEEVNE